MCSVGTLLPVFIHGHVNFLHGMINTIKYEDDLITILHQDDQISSMKMITILLPPRSLLNLYGAPIRFHAPDVRLPADLLANMIMIMAIRIMISNHRIIE